MPNDIPDWTAQAKANLVGGVSGLNLGDVGAPTLLADQAIEQITLSGGASAGANAALASFKALGTIAIVKVGAFLRVASTPITPQFGQATTAGNLLVCWVTAAGVGFFPTTTAPGWVKAADNTAASTGEWAAVWYKPNCGSNETPPTFTAVGSTNVMMAQLAEFSGAATASPVDQTAVTGNSPPLGTLTLTMPASDVAFGDLVVLAVQWGSVPAATATFVDSYNNGGAAVHVGDSGATSGPLIASFSYAIIPPATVAQPLGVADWAYDSDGQSAPGAGVTASVVLAATPGKTYTAAYLACFMANQANAAAREEDCQLKDGTTVRKTVRLSNGPTAGDHAGFAQGGLGYKGTLGNSMTWAFTSAGTNIFYSADIGAYLR